eukprot:CAMPEP_0113587072 /NCGR_PEP_ID=MMETSP0015_2-20120614/34673_1 /TAXON_ID=2838 /ORGANISM="Odontella" /LENGTH=138 /DNA_ID=CAMNT_0000492627 /DNA_START=12 /DNA_END=424 /DNA_ORIENTATION=+ /assembly_acc=CAM_ASM_000160
MSRKASADKSSWSIPSIYAFVGGYGPFRTKAFDPIEEVVVLLFNGDSDSFVSTNEAEWQRPAMHSFAGEAQGLLLNSCGSSSQDPIICNGILVVDVRDMFEDQEEFDIALKNEAKQDDTLLDSDQGKMRREKGCSKLL